MSLLLAVLNKTCGCYHSLPLPDCAVYWSAVRDCGISWPYSLIFFYTVLESGAAITTELFLMMSIVICMRSKRISDYASVTEIKRAL